VSKVNICQEYLKGGASQKEAKIKMDENFFARKLCPVLLLLILVASIVSATISAMNTDNLTLGTDAKGKNMKNKEAKDFCDILENQSLHATEVIQRAEALATPGDVFLLASITVYVDDDFTDDPTNHKWDTIQEGITDANDGDTVLVYNGTYTETVALNKRLTLTGVEQPTIDAQSLGDAINITADNCTVRGFSCVNAQPSPYAGIRVDSSNNVIVENTCRDNYEGIYLLGSSNEIRNNVASSNNKYGIRVQASDGNIVVNNRVKDNGGNGIYLKWSNDNRITDNDIANNEYHGISVSSSNSNEVRNNAANSNHYQGIGLWSSTDNIISNNTVNENGNNGIYLKESNDNRITDNVASNNVNYHGISLKSSNNNEIRNNVADSNHYDGIKLRNSTDNIIANNAVTNNEDDGISLTNSNNNRIYMNNFMDNDNNVYSEDSTNIWHSPSELDYIFKGNTYTNYLGNYWDDYTGSDTDNDGIGDSHYFINSDKDIYPLKESLENYFVAPETNFDTGEPANPYPSTMGTHTGTIKPTKTITISKLYTYPCPGTGGHTEYVWIHGNDVNASATWNGYQSTSDYHLIEFAAPVTLEEGVTYDYTIRTGSYPQIHHSNAVQTATGWLNCTEFADANEKVYDDCIPAIRLLTPTSTPTPIASKVIRTSEEGTVEHPSGAMIYVPQSAVPLNLAGDEGEMLFTIERGSPEDFGVPSTPPSGWEFVGDMHSMGPEGFIFEIPIRATMPLPDNFDYEQCDVRMFDYDRAAGEWVSVGGEVNEGGAALSADVLHLCANILLAQQWNGKGHGAIRFDAIPRYSFKLCIESYTLKYPDWDARFNAANRFRSIMRRDAYGCPADGKQYWRLPQGTYTLSVAVYRHGDDPLNTPEYIGYFQKTITIDCPHWDWQRGSHAPDYEFAVYFGDLAQWTNPDRLTPERPPCMGTPTPSVGIGAINVRLDWRAEADLDLWVIDPCNNKIFWDDTSAKCKGSWGKLDLDNKCSGIVLGRPENIFWQSNPPPGTYKVYVDYYGDCNNAGTVHYTVTWWIDGKAYSKSGTISPSVGIGTEGDEVLVTTFKY